MSSDDDIIPVEHPPGSDDILERVKKLLPKRWFAWTAPNRDAIIGGLSDSAAFYKSFIDYARLQTRLATVTGIWLDIFSFDYLGRYLYRNGAIDSAFRLIVQATILQERVTRAGMVSAISKLVGIPPQIIEPWNPNDCGGYGIRNVGYGRAGAWGSIALQNQVFIKISRSGLAPSGVPSINGYGGWNSGYASPATSAIILTSTTFGSAEYVGSAVAQIGITDDIIEQIIGATRPTATIAWIRFADGQPSVLVQSSNLFQSRES